MTKKEFKKRWNKDDRGDGITCGDIADCAKEWKLYITSKTHTINQVKLAVLSAANCRE